MISVCMATYNGESYIKRQLESILTQLGEDDEVVIVDDCSKDGTVKQIKKINDSRILIFENIINLGVNKTFEQAILRSRGDIIFLSDQDDFWYEDKISSVCNFFNNHLDVDLIQHDAIVMDDDENIISESLFNLIGYVGDSVVRNFLHCSYMGCCMAFRRILIKDIMPITNVPYHDYWIGIMAKLYGHKIEFIHKPLMNFIRHKDSLTTDAKKKRSIYRMIKDRVDLLFDIVMFKLRRGF